MANNTPQKKKKTIIAAGETQVIVCDEHSVGGDFVVEENATLFVIDINGKQPVIDKHIRIELVGKGATGKIRSACVGRGSEVQTVRHSITHSASYTTSDILVKGVLYDEAQTAYSGEIIIPKQAAQTIGHQSADFLLLSPKVKISAIPDLHIANKDVQCSHGVTITNIKEETLFYAQSRGLSQKEATDLQVQAHLASVYDGIPQEYEKSWRK